MALGVVCRGINVGCVNSHTLQFILSLQGNMIQFIITTAVRLEFIQCERIF